MINERKYLKDSLYDWISAVVQSNGRTDEVIWRDDNGPRPVAPFISIEIIGGHRRGSPWKSQVKIDPKNPDGPGKQIIMQPVKKAFTMYGFGEGSFDLLETIRDSVYLDEYRTMLSRKGLAITQTFDVTGVGFEMDGVREAQPHFDFVVVFNRVITDRPGWIEHVIVETDDLPMKPIKI